MAHILTITMNPAIDISTTVELVQPFRKLRCAPARRDPGGGGINVARVLNRLEVDVTALYPAGGFYGQLLQNLLQNESIRSRAIPIDEETREDFTVEETSSGSEYRFVSTGPLLQQSEWRACLEEIAAFREPVDMIVASGSLPPGVPEDFYAEVTKIARARAVPIALDTSGPPLRAALEHGVDWLKPSLREMRELTGAPLADPASCIAACRFLVTSGKAGAVALTLGSQGAILVTREGAWRAWPLPIKAVSTVGAGDSFLAAMVFALTAGRPHAEAFAHGVAGGSAALLSPGTQLCHPDDMRELLTHVHVDRAA